MYGRSIIAICALALACASPAAPRDGVPTEGEGHGLNDSDLVLVEREASVPRAAWRGVFPGRTTVEQVVSLVGEPLARESEGTTAVFIYAPGSHRGESKIDKTFGRVVRVVFNENGVVAYVHIGGFFPTSRPTLESVAAAIQGLTQVSTTSRLNAHAGVWDAPLAGVWVIASNIPDRSGRHQVLAMRFYDPEKRPVLPVPVKPYTK